MTNSNQPWTKRLPRSDIFAGLIALFGFFGFLDASYLTAQHYFTLPLPCSLTQGCDTVLTSSYATIAGIPVAFLGVLYYLTILFCAVYLLTSQTHRVRVARIMRFVVSAAVLLSGVFVYLQIFVIHALCMYCLGSATLTLTLFILAILLNRVLAKGKPPKVLTRNIEML